MEAVQIPCPYAPDCVWQSIPLDFDKALVLVEQHVKFRHPEAAEQAAKVGCGNIFSSIVYYLHCRGLPKLSSTST